MVGRASVDFFIYGLVAIAVAALVGERVLLLLSLAEAVPPEAAEGRRFSVVTRLVARRGPTPPPITRTALHLPHYRPQAVPDHRRGAVDSS